MMRVTLVIPLLGHLSGARHTPQDSSSPRNRPFSPPTHPSSVLPQQVSSRRLGQHTTHLEFTHTRSRALKLPSVLCLLCLSSNTATISEAITSTSSATDAVGEVLRGLMTPELPVGAVSLEVHRLTTEAGSRSDFLSISMTNRLSILDTEPKAWDHWIAFPDQHFARACSFLVFPVTGTPLLIQPARPTQALVCWAAHLSVLFLGAASLSTPFTPVPKPSPL